MAKKVLKYTEDEFITLLENIVKRVKREEMLAESRKERFNKAKNIVRRNRG
jgi:hypothetical protein